MKRILIVTASVFAMTLGVAPAATAAPVLEDCVFTGVC
jgi:hypothetical protein